MSRRRLLGTVGAGAVGTMLAPSWAGARGVKVHTATMRSDRFGRLFALKPFADETPKTIKALKALGAPGGPMDAGDDLAAGPIGLILNPGANRDNPAHPAGMTFLGQFIDHDLYAGRDVAAGDGDRAGGDGQLPLADVRPRRGLRLRAVRRPCPLRGRRHAPAHRCARPFEDVPRTADGTALIGDARNDENVAVSGLHAAFLRFHNAVLDKGAAANFEAARRLVTWHWQWIVVNEFLPLTIGAADSQSLLAGGRTLFKRKSPPFIPVEFQGAAYRFGHSQVRPSYRVNFTGAADGGQRFAFIFDATQVGAADPTDMQGGIAGPGRHLGWPTFFRFDDERAQFTRTNKRIDTKLSSPLFHLPPKVVRGPEDVLSLAPRNLLRHLTWSLPSGQALARKLGVPVLEDDRFEELGRLQPRLAQSTPLWYYVLKEAEVAADGLHLGPLGGLLVGGVIVGLLRADKSSYLSAAPGWTPTFGTTPGMFAMTDLLDYAGVGAVR